MNLVKDKRVRRAVLLAALCTGVPVAATQDVTFAPGWDSHWRHSAGNNVCALTLPVGVYGEARFVADPANPPAFELQARTDLHEPGPLTVAKYAPDWHPAAPLFEDLGTLSHIEGGGAVTRGKLAAAMLTALRQGLHIELAAPAWYDKRSDVRVHLHAKDLAPALDEFLRCAHTNVKVSWQELSRTRVSYEVDAHALDDAGRARLNALARYVLEDPSVTKLYIDGHTDGSGEKRSNYRLSKRRAEAVASYLRQRGVRDEQMVVRYHGAAYPVADNKTLQGKAKNRRTTVRLAREDSAVAARK